MIHFINIHQLKLTPMIHFINILQLELTPMIHYINILQLELTHDTLHQYTTVRTDT